MRNERQEDSARNGVDEELLDNEVEENNIEDDIEDSISEVQEKAEQEMSIEDDIREAQEQLKNKVEPESKEESATEGTTAKPAPKVDFDPPARFTAEEKEQFNKLPKNMKPIVKKTIEDFQADYTRGKQLLNESYKQSEGVIKAVQPYLTKWNLAGVTVEQAVAGLAATQDRLTSKDVETRKQAYAELFVNSGLSGEDFIDILQGAGIETPQKNNMSQNYNLPDEYKSAIDYASRLKQQEEENYINSLTSEFESVRNEIDSAGRYIYPKLHDANFNSQFVKPLVSKLMETLPELSFGDAVKRAYYTLEGYQQRPVQSNFQPAISTRLPNENNRSSYRTVVAPTVKGQGMPKASNFRPEADEVPDSIEDSIRMAMMKVKNSY